MPLESTSTLSGLVITNPAGTDQRKTADDHIRLLKSVLQSTFLKADGVSVWDTMIEVDPINVSNGWIPIKGTIMYQGDPADLPSNWQLSDGTNGTKDLRNKFIVAGYQWDAISELWETSLTGTDTTTGGTSGASTITSSATAVTINDHTLTLAEIPSHTHFVASAGSYSTTISSTNYLATISDYGVDYSNVRLGGRVGSADVGLSSSAGSGDPHGHTSPTHTHTVAYPAYYTLAFIVRMS